MHIHAHKCTHTHTHITQHHTIHTVTDDLLKMITHAVINCDNEKLIKLTFVLCYFICIAYSTNNRAIKPKRRASCLNMPNNLYIQISNLLLQRYNHILYNN